MLNKEKYAKEILDVACRGERFAFVENKIIPCNKTSCRSCYFYALECGLNKEEWANNEYVESLIDWSKVAVDTPILVRNNENDKWRKRHFAKYEDKKVYAWSKGLTFWSIAYIDDMRYWKYAKLAEE